MAALIITEKPSVAADIAAALGGFTKHATHHERPDLLITFALGHLVEIAMKEDADPGFNLARLPAIPDPFVLRALPPSKGSRSTPKQRLDAIKALAKRADVDLVINACDAGREGELIFRLIMGFIGVKKPIERLWMQSMTPAGIKRAFNERLPDAAKQPLAAAARCRAESDWLIGINATRALTKANFVAPGELVTAGRVQTPVLTLVVDLEERIRSFVSRPFWEVEATLDVAAGEWKAKWFDHRQGGAGEESEKNDKDKGDKGEDEKAKDRNRFFDPAQAQAIVAACQGVAPAWVRDTTQPITQRAPGLFDLTTLQRVANTKLGYSAAETLKIAQALYESHKVLTYPRTDSAHLPEDYPSKVEAVLKMMPEPFSAPAAKVIEAGWVVPRHPVFNDAKISDHFAIIPTGKMPSGLNEREAAIFRLVVLRFIAAFYPAAQFNRTTRVAEIADHRFRTSGKVLTSPGWLAVYGGKVDASEEDGVNLPVIAPDEPARNLAIALKQGKTKPPARYTEATLLGAMETAGKLVEDQELADAMKGHGLGTPATRAATIEELLSERKGYLKRNKKELVPSDKAIMLVTSLRELGIELLTSPTLTGEWEHRLARIEAGTDSRPAFMTDIKIMTMKLVEQIRARALPGPNADTSPAKPTDIECRCKAGPISERSRSWSCASCGLVIFKEVAQKKLPVAALRDLLEHGKTRRIAGFTSRAGKLFEAALVLSEAGKVEFDFG